MIESVYPPLNYPQNWPPVVSPPPPPGGWETSLKRIPVAGWITASLISRFRKGQHEQEVLSFIEKEIVDQLEARGKVNNWFLKYDWFDSPVKQQIAVIVSEAIGLEKPVEFPPPLHPEDPFGLLFWGPFDDLTPLIVGLDIQKKWKCYIPRETISLAFDDNWTLIQFIEYCEDFISDS